MGVAQRVAEGPALALGRAVAERRPLGGGRDARDGQRGERVPLGGRQTLGDARPFFVAPSERYGFAVLALSAVERAIGRPEELPAAASGLTA